MLNTVKFVIEPQWHWDVWNSAGVVNEFKRQPEFFGELLGKPQAFMLGGQRQTVWKALNGCFGKWKLFPARQEISLEDMNVVEQGLLQDLAPNAKEAVDDTFGALLKVQLAPHAVRDSMETTTQELEERARQSTVTAGTEAPEAHVGVEGAAAGPSPHRNDPDAGTLNIFGFQAPRPQQQQQRTGGQQAQPQQQQSAELKAEAVLTEATEAATANLVHLSTEEGRTCNLQVRHLNQIVTKFKSSLQPCVANQYDCAGPGQATLTELQGVKDLLKAQGLYKPGSRVPNKQHVGTFMLQVGKQFGTLYVIQHLDGPTMGCFVGNKLARCHIEGKNPNDDDQIVWYAADMTRRLPWQNWGETHQADAQHSNDRHFHQHLSALIGFRAALESVNTMMVDHDERKRIMMAYIQWFFAHGGGGFIRNPSAAIDTQQKLLFLLMLVSAAPQGGYLTLCPAIKWAQEDPRGPFVLDLMQDSTGAKLWTEALKENETLKAKVTDRELVDACIRLLEDFSTAVSGTRLFHSDNMPQDIPSVQQALALVTHVEGVVTRESIDLLQREDLKRQLVKVFSDLEAQFLGQGHTRIAAAIKAAFRGGEPGILRSTMGELQTDLESMVSTLGELLVDQPKVRDMLAKGPEQPLLVITKQAGYWKAWSVILKEIGEMFIFAGHDKVVLGSTLPTFVSTQLGAGRDAVQRGACLSRSDAHWHLELRALTSLHLSLEVLICWCPHQSDECALCLNGCPTVLSKASQGIKSYCELLDIMGNDIEAISKLFPGGLGVFSRKCYGGNFLYYPCLLHPWLPRAQNIVRLSRDSYDALWSSNNVTSLRVTSSAQVPRSGACRVELILFLAFSWWLLSLVPERLHSSVLKGICWAVGCGTTHFEHFSASWCFAWRRSYSQALQRVCQADAVGGKGK